MKFVNPLPFVADMVCSRKFYADLLGFETLEDHGNFVMFADGFALHEGSSLLRSTYGDVTHDEGNAYGRQNLVLYFEVGTEETLEARFLALEGKIDLIHPIRTECWGGRVFRFHDPDGHIIEIGEKAVDI